MSIEETAAAINSKIGEASGFGASIKFDCGDDGIISIDGNASPPSVSTEDSDADCTVKLSLDTLKELIDGELDPTAAFMSGKLKVEGDMSVGMKIGSIL